ncbi:hypothetical protein GQ464_002560 [Rhodocaloribacter litoris]|uniref:hypothetical protein n=1 Tax=Rhodocaloribacter litoris TaxID=2558931 RepID=UPI001E3FCCAD|nr:hypothetical protein [Rhodocaloribacter litoris]QXD15850.1 hypothetical protein GQ464_002560 [Rhodocaloribacter litoris]
MPGLTPANTAAAPDCFLELTGPSLHLSDTDARGELTDEVHNPFGQSFKRWITRDAAGAHVHLLYAQGSEFVRFDLAPRGERIRMRRSATVTLEEATTLLLGPVLGQVLRLRNVTCLHANAVAVNGRAILLAGHTGAGKSSTTVMLARMGCPVVTDDIAALVEETGGLHVLPGLPRLRLRADLVARYWTPAALEPVWPGRETLPDKRFLSLDRAGLAAAMHPLPIAAVYLLGPRDPGRTLPRVVPLHAATGLLALLPHTYARWALDQAGEAREFAVLGRLAASVPVRQLERPDGLDTLTATCELLLQDAAGLVS